ncbi:hypothetical protein [Aliiruegeria lutimaris]|uniref:N-acetyltransferase domain-containing protein n=1 Tax=Aliiruegeria lutimaris TaxID=571298 RepID=A0A1G8MPN3_9RHOB|nr:hypothetical protein [Aliiruegeria lutimaris]SDI69988.1 hypothetical protein SAMN04488026_100613 [Aliiruegeria lutimaris]
MTQEFNHGTAHATLFPDAPDWEGAPTMAVGKFSCGSVKDGAAVLAEATAAAREAGARRLLGPMDGTTWNSYRLVTETDGTPPFLMEPTSGPSDLAAFEAAGFAPIARYFSARVTLAGMDNPPPVDPEIRVETWDGTDPEAHFSQVYDLSLSAFSGNAFYTPISREAFLGMYLPFVPVIRREFVLFAYNSEGALVGFLFGIPNYGAGPAPDTVILKTYASLQHGAGQALASVFHSAAQEAGFATAIHALIHETNVSAQRSAQLGGRMFRRYALMGKVLDDNPA